MFDCSDSINKKNMLSKNGFEKFEFQWIWHYLFKTLNHIIFAVFVPDLINNCLPILGSILERGARGWHVQYRQKMMRDLQGQCSYCTHTCYYYKNLIPRAGICFCFLALIIRSKKMPNIKIWSDDALQATGHGPAHGIQFLKNRFKVTLWKRIWNKCCLFVLRVCRQFQRGLLWIKKTTVCWSWIFCKIYCIKKGNLVCI